MGDPTADVWQSLLETRRELVELSVIHDRCEGFDANDYTTAVHVGRKTMLNECIEMVQDMARKLPRWKATDTTHYQECWKHHPECALVAVLATLEEVQP